MVDNWALHLQLYRRTICLPLFFEVPLLIWSRLTIQS
uniref:Uncharacterized protein n=1 Tax=Arundo donax TaxID=35708 RepID=A0A0A8ZNP6_ARUDO